jgi:hypothetical protein
MQISSINSWRGQAGLATYGTPETLANMAVTLVMYCVAYASGLGVARLFRPLKQADEQNSQV